MTHQAELSQRSDVNNEHGAGELPTRRVSPGLVLLILSVAAVAAVAGPGRAYADAIPAADIEVTAEGGTAILTAGTVSGTAFNGGPEGGSEASTATASFSGGDASASASGSTSGGVSTANSSALGEVTFFFEVQGSATGVTTVPLIFAGGGTTSASGPDAEAFAYFETPGGQFYSCSSTIDPAGVCGTEPASNSGSIHYNATPGALEDIQVIASGESTGGTGSWSASVDPEVEIDPSFAEAGDFTLDFSPDVPGGTVPPAMPEPSGLAMLGISLLALMGLKLKRLGAAVKA